MAFLLLHNYTDFIKIGILVNITNICKKIKKIKYYKKNRPLRGHWNIPRNQVKKIQRIFSSGFTITLHFLVILLFNYSH